MHDVYYELVETNLTNREKAMRAKLGKHWCMSCDMAMVGKVGKCPVCGKRANRKKKKMP